jgi:hypothetical protein
MNRANVAVADREQSGFSFGRRAVGADHRGLILARSRQETERRRDRPVIRPDGTQISFGEAARDWLAAAPKRDGAVPIVSVRVRDRRRPAGFPREATGGPAGQIEERADMIDAVPPVIPCKAFHDEAAGRAGLDANAQAAIFGAMSRPRSQHLAAGDFATERAGDGAEIRRESHRRDLPSAAARVRAVVTPPGVSSVTAWP